MKNKNNEEHKLMENEEIRFFLLRNFPKDKKIKSLRTLPCSSQKLRDYERKLLLLMKMDLRIILVIKVRISKPFLGTIVQVSRVNHQDSRLVYLEVKM